MRLQFPEQRLEGVEDDVLFCYDTTASGDSDLIKTIQEVAREERASVRGQLSLREPSPWLKKVWDEATNAAREARWNWVPEEIADHATAITRRDVAFLCDLAVGGDPVDYYQVRAAVRSLGHVGEALTYCQNEIVELLLQALESGNAGVRQVAAEALWQIGNPKAEPTLAAALKREADETVRATLESTLASLARPIE